MGLLSEIKEEIRVIRERDPAMHSNWEVFLYSSFHVMLAYRKAHKQYLKGHYFRARQISQRAARKYNIEIHPGATIGKGFFIDHGTGVVIGETAIVGDNVTLYQGVTLGARNFRYDASGRPVNIPRHPILEDNVTVYSNTSILGRVTIGHDTVVGGNIWLTHDVPPHSRILQGRAIYVREFDEGEGI